MSSAGNATSIRRRRSAADLLAFAEAWLGLGGASLTVALVPFARAMRAAPSHPPRVIGRDELARLVWAVKAAGRRSWLRSKCIERALALRTMLRRRGVPSTLHYGIRQTETEGLEAHVWLSVDGVTVLGGETAALFAEVATFAVE
jgi:hypothetical protein